MAMAKESSRRQFLQTAAVAAAGVGPLLGACRRGPGARPRGVRGVAPAVNEAPRRGGRIRLGIVDGDQAGNLDVHKPTGTASVIRGFAAYSKLWEWSEEMTPRLALAEFAEPNADASAWTIRLRPGLEFHHGKTISADDVIFSIRRLTDPELASPYANLVSPLDRNRIEKLDARTVRVHAKPQLGFVPLPDAWVNFGGIVPLDYHPVTNPVGAGPYRIKDFRPGQRCLFTRFENYFKPGRPYADELEVIEFKDQPSRLAALLGDQIDLAHAVLPEQMALFQNHPRVSLQTSVTYGWQGFNLNLNVAPFRDDRVRQAFRLLADRRDLVARALNGQGRVANDLYSPQDPTFNRDIAQREPDLEKARHLLKQAGAEGLALDLVTTVPNATAALVFSAQAKRAGVDLRVKKVDLPTFNGPAKKTWAISAANALGQSFLCTGINQDAPVSVANRTGFRDPRFGELFLAALKQPDVDQRRPLIHEAQRIQHERGGLLIWGFVNTLDGVSNRVGGVKPEHSHFSTWRFDTHWLRDHQT